jgi:exodeoxyribonuclease V alpha subunit
VRHAQYGWQFKAEQAIPRPPQSQAGIEAYLADTVYGVGPASARLIYRHFGDDTMAILDEDPGRIREVKGLKRNLADNLIKVWDEGRAQRGAMVALQGYGISARAAHAITNTYGTQALQMLKDNPYQIIRDIRGFGFKRADSIALQLGIPRDSRFRIQAGLMHTLAELAGDGHTYAPGGVLLESAIEKLGLANGSGLEAILRETVFRGEIIEDEIATPTEEPQPVYYLPQYYRAETDAARRLLVMRAGGSQILEATEDTDWDAFTGQLASEHGLALSGQQVGAVRAALTHKVSVLTGGPGTGKTTTLRMVIHALERLPDIRYALASPTGRAAKRLAEATEREASTIHRLLKWVPEDGSFFHDESDPLPVDMLILDECSMIDTLLFASVLRALKPDTHLMMVGDVDQLPSVGAGNVLHDVIEGAIGHVTRLSQIFRQDHASQIIVNAHRVNQGQMPLTDNQGRDFFFFGADTPQAAGDLVEEIVGERIRRRFDGADGLGPYDPLRDIQVIAPMYRGPAGVDTLNRRLQALLNGDERRAKKVIQGRTLRVGDKVMQTRNNYELNDGQGAFNGDIGYVQAIDQEAGEIHVRIDDQLVVYDETAAEDLIHAFCISTHRSQGSEYPVVVMPILTGHYVMLQRNLLYTAITRARELVVMVGDRRAIAMAVKNDRVAERNSGLLTRLRAL